MNENEITYQSPFNRIVASIILLLLILRAYLLFQQSINWDEFNFLSMIHSALRGEQIAPLQTGYIHAFKWLAHVPGNEVDQIIAARLVMFLLQAGTFSLIFVIAREISGSRLAALTSVLIYASFSYTIEHDTSFRYDPIAIFLIMLALWLLIREPHRWIAIILAGMLTAIAGMVTIKAIFYIPTLTLALFYLSRSNPMRQRFSEFFVYGIVSLICFFALYVFHSNSIEIGKNYSTANSLTGIASKVFIFEQIFPRDIYLKISLYRDTLHWALLLIGLMAAITTVINKNSRHLGIGLIGLSLPLATLIFYRNAFPYYYVFIMATPAVLVAWAIISMKKNLGAINSKLFHIIFALFILIISSKVVIQHGFNNATGKMIMQRQIIDVVHHMFPQPVPYIDRASMISSFPKVGFFMSTWGIENYRKKNQPIMPALLVRHKPKFLLADVRLDPYGEEKQYSLLKEDIHVLHENFIPHWGPIWVAGKHMVIPTAATTYQFEILIPGPYTVEGHVELLIDGTEQKPGAVVELEAGNHTIIAAHAPTMVTLRWGQNIYRPTVTTQQPPVFVPF
jgi:hypothetical protein